MSSSRAPRCGRLVALLFLGPAGCLAIDTPSKAPPEGPGGTWTTLAPMPSRRQEVAAAEAGGTIYVLGGELPFRIVSATEAYDPATDRGTAQAPLPTPRHGLGAAAVGARVYVAAGGTRPEPGRADVREAFEP